MRWRKAELKRLTAEVTNPFRDKRCKYGIEAIDVFPAGSLWREVYDTVTLSTNEPLEYMSHLEILKEGSSKVRWTPSSQDKNETFLNMLKAVSEPVDESTASYATLLPFYNVDADDILPALLHKGIVSNQQVLNIIKELDALPYDEWPKA